MQSEHVLTEVNEAFDKRHLIIPFRVEDVVPNDDLRYYIGRAHWLNAHQGSFNDHLKTLSETIKNSL